MMGELIMKRCPHCNGEATLTSNYNYRIRKYFVFAKGDICGAQGKITVDGENPAENGWNDDACNTAIAAWNLRFYKEGDHVCQT